jgi:hypothetical protein
LGQTRDGLILINGNWGVGKTYFLQNELKNFYTQKTLFYISALGLNSLQDFKDRMFSISYLDSNDEIKRIGELTASASAALTQEEGVGKLTNEAISFLTGVMKEYVLKDLQGVYIVDDLERIPLVLRNDIATYCLQRYQKDSRVDYILVGNFSDESSQILNHKEKVISDEVTFSLNNLPDILELKLKDITLREKELISQVIIGFEVTNLRFINRVLDKLIPLLEAFSSEKEIKESDITNLTSSLCAHIILKERFFYQVDEFHKRYLSSSLKSLTMKNEESNETISKQENDLLSIAAYKSYDGMMPQYCFNIISIIDMLPKIITRSTPLQKEEYADLPLPEISGISELDYCEEISKAILKHNNPNLSTWLTATNNYIRLSEEKYISKIKGVTKKTIEKNKKSFSDNEIEEFFLENHKNIKEIPLHILYREQDELFNFFLNRYIEIIKLKKIVTLTKRMNEDGWGSVDFEIYQSDFKFKLLETLGLDAIVSGVKRAWSVQDIKLFTDHLSSLYNFSNLADYLSGELPFLSELQSVFSAHLKGIKNSFRKGAIIELVKCIERVKNLLEANITLKQPPINNV